MLTIPRHWIESSQKVGLASPNHTETDGQYVSPSDDKLPSGYMVSHSTSHRQQTPCSRQIRPQRRNCITYITSSPLFFRCACLFANRHIPPTECNSDRTPSPPSQNCSFRVNNTIGLKNIQTTSDNHGILLRMWVRIPPGVGMSVCCECCVLSGRGLCDGLITRPEDFRRLWCVVVRDL